VSERETDPLTDDGAEIVDALVVPEGHSFPSAPPPPPQLVAERAGPPARTVPVAQAAAVAATGFAAGAVTAVVVRGMSRRRAGKAVGRRQAKGRQPVAGTRSFLVDVHLLSPKD